MELSPEDEQEIKKLMHFCRLGGKVRIPAEKPPEMQSALDGIRLMLTMVPALKIFKEYKGMDTRDLMERFQHPLIRCMISDFCTRESMASSFPLAYGSFAAGMGAFKGRLKRDGRSHWEAAGEMWRKDTYGKKGRGDSAKRWEGSGDTVFG